MMPHYLLHPVGSHGDVHPFVGLGRELLRRGRRVTVFTAEPFRGLVEGSGLAFTPTASADDYRAVVHDPGLWHPSKSLRVLFGGERAARSLRASYEAMAAQVDPANPRKTVVVSGSLGLSARVLHDKFKVPLATVHLQPGSLLSVVDPPRFPDGNTLPRWLPHWARRAVYLAADRLVMDRLLSPSVNGLRQELGLPKVKRIFGPWRHSPERLILAFPAWYASAPDWPAHAVHTNFPRFDQSGDAKLSPELSAFLAAGSPPIAATFGTAMRQAGAAFRVAVDAFSKLDVRGLILAKAGEQIPTGLPATVFHAEYAPFSQVFSRCAAVIHHGGIGTSAQTLTAGVPHLIRPMAFDQPDNAARLARLGVARSLPVAEFTPGAVAAALRHLLDSPAVAAACKTHAARLAGAEPGERAMADAVEAMN